MNRWEQRAVYDSHRWKRLRARVMRGHLARHGPWCPGWDRDSHQAWDLTCDHIVPMSMGGAPYDPGNVQILCARCNLRKSGESGRAEWTAESAAAQPDPAQGGGDGYTAKVGGRHYVDGISPREQSGSSFLPEAPVIPWCYNGDGLPDHRSGTRTRCEGCRVMLQQAAV